MTTIPVGTPVTFPHYGHTLTGIVVQDKGTGIVWVRSTESERVRWMHRDSLTVST